MIMFEGLTWLSWYDFYISAEIIMFEGLTCVYRSNVDLFFYVVGSSQENEVSKKQNIRGSKLCRSEVHDHSLLTWGLYNGC
jgi:hypothetical protein